MAGGLVALDNRQCRCHRAVPFPGPTRISPQHRRWRPAGRRCIAERHRSQVLPPSRFTSAVFFTLRTLLTLQCLSGPNGCTGQVSLLARLGCKSIAEKAVDTAGDQSVPRQRLLRRNTLKHDAGRELGANHDAQSQCPRCRRLQHSGTGGIACMRARMACHVAF